MTFTHEFISTRQLSTSKIGGYNKQEVDELIETIQSEYKKLEEKLKKANLYQVKANQFDENYSEIQEALVVAQKSKSEIIREAKSTADSIINAAKHRAKELVDEASKEATLLAQEVQSDTQLMISESKRISQEIIDDAQSTAKQILERIDKERSSYVSTHHKMIKHLEELKELMIKDDFLTFELTHKTASLETKAEVDKSQSQTKHDDLFSALSEKQIKALELLKKNQDNMKKLVEEQSHTKIETVDQAQDLLNKMRDKISS